MIEKSKCGGISCKYGVGGIEKEKERSWKKKWKKRKEKKEKGVIRDIGSIGEEIKSLGVRSNWN